MVTNVHPVLLNEEPSAREGFFFLFVFSDIALLMVFLADLVNETSCRQGIHEPVNLRMG